MFDKPTNREELISQIADELLMADYVYYDPISFEWRGVLESEILACDEELEPSDEEMENLREALNLPYCIEKPESFVQFPWREDFVNLHSSNTEFFKEAVNALSRRHPFRNFKIVLTQYPDLRKEWFEYEIARMKKYVEAELVIL